MNCSIKPRMVDMVSLRSGPRYGPPAGDTIRPMAQAMVELAVRMSVMAGIAVVVGCGGSPRAAPDAAAAIDAAEGDGSTGTDAAVDAPPPIVHHGYVVSSLLVPTDDRQVGQFGLDLGSKTSAAADGLVDNALGRMLALLNSLNITQVQPANTAAVDQGALLLLLDLQAPDLLNAAAANLQIELGANPVPAACHGAADTTCRHHLDGTASFSIAPDSPTDAVLPGHIVAGAFTGGPGHFTLPLAIGSVLVQLHLLHARVQASMISDADIMTADIGGLVTRDEVNTQIGPAIQQLVQAVIVRDCTPGAPPPGCGCSSTSALLLDLMDGDLGTPGDCVISTDEVLAFSFMKMDSCSMDTCTMPDALSIGVQVQAVKATFPVAL